MIFSSTNCSTVISDSAETSTDGISYITEELGSYAAPFNTVWFVWFLRLFGCCFLPLFPLGSCIGSRINKGYKAGS